MKISIKAAPALALIMLLLAAAGCVKPAEPANVIPAGEETAAPAETTEAPVEPTEAPVEPTEAPVETTEPTAEPTEAPTEAPVETIEPTAEPTEAPKSCFIPLGSDEPTRIDMDGDGIDDTVLITVSTDAEDMDLPSVSIKLSSAPDEPFGYTDASGFGLSAAIVDCDPADGVRELIVCILKDGAEYVTTAFRPDGAGSVSVFSEPMLFGSADTYEYGFPDGTEFDPAEGLPCVRNGEPGHFTVTENGIEF